MNPTTLMSPASADELARELNAVDTEGWRYEAKHDPNGTGYSFVAVFDNEGVEVGKL